jgi:hypothetical protein
MARSLRVADFDALGEVAALLEELRHASTDCAQLLAELAVGDLLKPRMLGRPPPLAGRDVAVIAYRVEFSRRLGRKLARRDRGLPQ